jgi:hypothetical protein
MPMRGNQHDVRVWRSRWMQGEHVPHVGIVSGEGALLRYMCSPMGNCLVILELTGICCTVSDVSCEPSIDYFSFSRFPFRIGDSRCSVPPEVDAEEEV